MATSTPTRPTFKPFVPATENRPELTTRALLLGAVFGVLFGAVTVYVGLRAGLTVAASIPISVLSISILRAFGKASILENNIVQSTGNAGQSIASGVIFTLPALVFLGFDLEYSRIFMLALIGGWLGVLFMIPLRRQLIVKEHGNLTYPEGTACADVLVAGERGGSFAGSVFWGLGIGGVYTWLMNSMQMWTGQPEYRPKWLPGASFRAAITSEYLGVGYIIGPKTAGTLFAGGVFSWLVLMPAIRFFGQNLTGPVYPSTIPISQMTPDQLWSSYVRPIGAGAVAAAGLITLLRTLPTIVSALTAGLKDVRAQRDGTAVESNRLERDLPMSFVLIGSLVLIAMMWALLTFKPIPGATTGMFSNLMAALLVIVFGFLFVTVSSRICGLIGTSSNPVSGMTIATLMATCAMFLVAGWTGGAFAALAITIGGVVAIAAANAGATSQDLKTGYLVGATPVRQQIGLIVGVLVASFFIGLTLIGMNKGLEKYTPNVIPINLAQLPEGVQVESQNYDHAGKTYVLINSLGSQDVPDGKYLYDPATSRIEIQWVQGIGSDAAPAPQARLMATVINGILTQRLPWRLVMLGVFLVVAIELLGVRSLSFAVGSYLSIATTAAIFAGGVVRWLAERNKPRTAESESEVSPGALFSSGLIAAGGVVGLLAIIIKLMEIRGWVTPDKFNVGTRWIGSLATNGWLGVAMFLLLASSLFVFARKKLE